jgi:anti-sigma regulatory factor (Ser/Thr protein kinase)
VEIRQEIQHGPQAAAQARRLLDSLGSGVGETILTQARLLLSEIVTDSYMRARHHGGLPIQIAVQVSRDQLRLEVIDRRSFDITAQTYEQMTSSMRGLALVNRVAADWGLMAEGGIWAEFALSKSED